MGDAVALAAVLPAGLFFGFAEIADFELELYKTFMPLARKRAGGKRGKHGAILFFCVGAIPEMAAGSERFDFGKRFLRAFARAPPPLVAALAHLAPAAASAWD